MTSVCEQRMLISRNRFTTLTRNPSPVYSRIKTYLHHKSFPRLGLSLPKDWLHRLLTGTVSSEHIWFRFSVFFHYFSAAFSAVTLLAGRQEEHLVCKNEWWGVGVVVCLDRGADCLHMVQLMPLHPQTPSSLASFKSRLVLPFWCWLTQAGLEMRTLNGVAAVVVFWVFFSSLHYITPTVSFWAHTNLSSCILYQWQIGTCWSSPTWRLHSAASDQVSAEWPSGLADDFCPTPTPALRILHDTHNATVACTATSA